MSSDKLAIVSKAKIALAKANTFSEVLRIQRTAKVIKVSEQDKYSKQDLKKGLSQALDARDKALQAGAIELLAEHKAGVMLLSLKTEKAGEIGVSFTQVCRDNDINSEIAKWWKKLAAEGLTEEDLSRYVEHVQNSTDPTTVRQGINLQGFRQFVDPNAPGSARAREQRHDYAVALLSMSTIKAIDLLVKESCQGKSSVFEKEMKVARDGVISDGVPRDAEQERQRRNTPKERI